ncbi:hypothetical protein Hanom_Chr12g01086801 [Helianthus anomalus]
MIIIVKKKHKNYVSGTTTEVPAAHRCLRGRLVVFPHPVKLPSSNPTTFDNGGGGGGGGDGGGGVTTGGGGSIATATDFRLPLVPFLLVSPAFQECPVALINPPNI